tara:strand:- start:60514 stop:60852 length:339 start_codon:yes stop_codon:yes gene_type:complete
MWPSERPTLSHTVPSGNVLVKSPIDYFSGIVKIYRAWLSVGRDLKFFSACCCGWAWAMVNWRDDIPISGRLLGRGSYGGFDDDQAIQREQVAGGWSCPRRGPGRHDVACAGE